ncbi:hypothetical protein [Nocardia bovistercoris]|uniref:Mce-associated membrane protein n=1 Tax=Nocardia bovistercoris TaxID=2785916 RepID=A0A931N4M0_9NOCA|nr:hypothetical protein [Nocardia bovistercoris]MBH0778401.1 hypothetical protein [Nocardia bovistercoris]
MNIDLSKEQPGAVEPDTEESDADPTPEADATARRADDAVRGADDAALAGGGAARAADDGTAKGGGEADAAVATEDASRAVDGKRGWRGGAAKSARVTEVSSDAPRRAPVAVTAVAVGALVVALITALWFGGTWARAAFLTDGPRVSARDSALDAARQAAINMTSMNLDDVPGSLAMARSSMTGAILESAQKNQQQSEQLAAQAGVGMQAKVLGASLTALNSENDKATALVVLQVTESKADKSVSDYRYTWSLDMTKVDDVWKAEQVASLAQPVLVDGAGPGGLGQPAQSGGAQQPGTAQPAAPSEPAPAPRPGS